VLFCVFFVCCCVRFSVHNYLRNGLPQFVFGVWVVSVVVLVVACGGERHNLLFFSELIVVRLQIRLVN